jgi:hypothetical protein
MAENGKYAPQAGKIPGTLVNLGGVSFVMPPLNLDQVKQFQDIINNAGQKPTMAENIEESLPVLHAALTRNYPDLTLEELRPLIDLGNFLAVSTALRNSSGLVPSKPGEPEPAAP